jgi:hypothetical protein
MLSYFCSKCGGKNLYQFQKPKFCSLCGVQFSASSVQPQNAIKSSKFEVNIINKNPNNYIEKHNDLDSEDSDDNVSYSSMRGLDVNIQKNNTNTGIKLSDLVSDEPQVERTSSKRNQQKPKRGRKKILKTLPESFTSEAKMTGRNYKDLSFEDGLE